MNDVCDSSRPPPGRDPQPRESLVTGRYPNDLESDVVVRTGASFRLRPIRSDDGAKLVAFHGRLSFDSIYRRYFSVHPELSDDEVLHLTQVDYVDRLALVVESDDELIAIGRYERCPSTTTAEVAFVVRDDYQHLGLGHRLLDALAAAALVRNITTFTAETLTENHGMMSVFRHSRFPMTTSITDGQVSVRLCIEPTSDPDGALEMHRTELA